ncbi:TraR/DksA C4-type zinc finger protein [Rahnella contaminans]|uniref:TraR/DksA C4-type zinc finger protein n=1 Tax=Rahnella contaminans TaxID=2703882 RepID=UPI003C2CB922
MGDFLDRVQDNVERYTQECLEQQLARRPPLQAFTPGPRFCEGCGQQIPEARIAAMPGTVLCVECKEWEERRNG